MMQEQLEVESDQWAVWWETHHQAKLALGTFWQMLYIFIHKYFMIRCLYMCIYKQNHVP